MFLKTAELIVASITGYLIDRLMCLPQKRLCNFVSYDMNRKAMVEFAIKPQTFWDKVLSTEETMIHISTTKVVERLKFGELKHPS